MGENRLFMRIEELEDKLDYYQRNAVSITKKIYKCGESITTVKFRFSGSGEVELFVPSGNIAAQIDSVAIESIGGGFYTAKISKGDHVLKFSGTAAVVKIELVGKGAKFC